MSLNMNKFTKKLPDTKTLLSAAASIAASAMLIRTISNEIIPDEVRDYFFSGLHSLTHHFSSQLTIVIQERKGQLPNQVFEAATLYLGTIMSSTVKRIQVSKAEEEKTLVVSVDRNEEIVDIFEDIKVTWKLVCTKQSNMVELGVELETEVKSFEVMFHRKYKDRVLECYFPYLMNRAKVMKEESKIVKLHTVDYDCWTDNPINLDHPMTFKTLAMDSDMKNELIEDLDNFVKGKEFYKRSGKAWKRGYLLYGPPGTGKSSLIAAMANYLNYDIYDLDLSSVDTNNELRTLLLGMSNRSILVIEDIDCSIKLQNRDSIEQEPGNEVRDQVTLSGLLNFIDGIWSCCGHERIIVFTTNHKERLDPALLRPGRMDMHVHMSYCTFSGFKQLAFSCHGVCDHKLFDHVEGLFGEAKVTPAEVAGELMKNPDFNLAILGFVKFLDKKIEEGKGKMEDVVKEEVKDEEKKQVQ